MELAATVATQAPNFEALALSLWKIRRFAPFVAKDENEATFDCALKVIWPERNSTHFPPSKVQMFGEGRCASVDWLPQNVMVEDWLMRENQSGEEVVLSVRLFRLFVQPTRRRVALTLHSFRSDLSQVMRRWIDAFYSSVHNPSRWIS